MSRPVPCTAFRPRSPAALAALCALMALAMLASPRSASAAQLYGTRTVYYKLSDLATGQGTRALYRRIAKAAAMVCPPEESLRPFETAMSRQCQRQAIARVVAKIGNARLAAISAQKLARYR
ncbi:MAG: UrcA family protein [Gammaproteobacteria bacterium]|nr:UrcA family protein [Gammaproteobacteria bacterium]